MKKSKKFLLFLLVTLICLTNINFSMSSADEQRKGLVNATNVRVRTGPGTNYSILKIDGKNQYYDYNQELLILKEEMNGNEKWYNVRFTRNSNEYEGWIRSDYVQEIIEIDDTDFDEYLVKQGFPESYRPQLRQLHALHPNWKFVAYNTKLDWNAAVAKESRIGVSLINGNNLALRSVDPKCYDVETGKFIPYDGTTWFCANSETVAYYMDPRNFLSEISVFMFVSLAYNANETAEVVQKNLQGTFMSGNDKVNGKKYADMFVEAGKNAGVSPVYLAALSRQEVGTKESAAVSGNSFTYNGKTYSGLYNFFNIGATSGKDNWKKGLVYANGGEDGSKTTYNRPWTSPYKAIIGGALFIANGYIRVGQNTMYFQKFNVTGYHTYSHQYQTNVRAAASQSSIMYSTYKNSGSLENELIFTIPVFNNMPEKTELPTTYTLPTKEDETKPDEPVTPVTEPEPEPVVEPEPEPVVEPEPEPTPEPEPVIGGNDPLIPAPVPEPVVTYDGDLIKDMNLFNNNGLVTGISLGTTYTTMKNRALGISKDIGLTMTTSGGKEIAGKDVLATNQKMLVKIGDKSYEYTIVLKGDINGDGEIDISDLLLMKKDLLDVSKLKGANLNAACVNGQEEVSLEGYLAIKKMCLGEGKIENK